MEILAALLQVHIEAREIGETVRIKELNLLAIIKIGFVSVMDI